MSVINVFAGCFEAWYSHVASGLGARSSQRSATWRSSGLPSDDRQNACAGLRPWLQLPRHLRMHSLDVLVDVLDDPVVERPCDDRLRDAIAGARPPFPELGAGLVEPVATDSGTSCPLS